MLQGISRMLGIQRWSVNDEDSAAAAEEEHQYFVDLEPLSINRRRSSSMVNNCRSSLPSVMIQRGQISIWSILKQSVGKELSKVTMPVVFNEPLSFLQRLTEYLEYYEILKQAAQETDPLKRIELVAAFAVSAPASNWERVGKPFNPILGETYELDRLDDLGFRWISEQVSHHPPVSAFYTDGEGFKFYGSIYPKLRFWGRSVEIQPKGVVTLELTKMNDVYTWSNVSVSVHNLVMGTPYIEQQGTMEIVSHISKLSCTLNFKAGNAWLNRDSAGHHIEGFVVDEKGHRLRALYGVWTNFLASVDVPTFERHFPNWGRERKARVAAAGSHASTSTSTTVSNEPVRRTPSAPPTAQKALANTASLDGGNHPQGIMVNNSHHQNQNQQAANNHHEQEDGHHHPPAPVQAPLPILTGSKVLWQVRSRPSGNEKYYHFTAFAMMLNEPPSSTDHKLAPTDSRLRPDIQHLEKADLDGAASTKNRLEEKQREALAKRKKSKAEWHPLWFRYEKHPYVNEDSWIFTNEYWSRIWSKCPDIF